MDLYTKAFAMAEEGVNSRGVSIQKRLELQLKGAALDPRIVRYEEFDGIEDMGDVAFYAYLRLLGRGLSAQDEAYYSAMSKEEILKKLLKSEEFVQKSRIYIDKNGKRITGTWWRKAKVSLKALARQQLRKLGWR